MSSDRIHHRFLRASFNLPTSSHSSSDPHTHCFPSHPTSSASPELPCSIDSRSEVALCRYPLYQWSQSLFQHGTVSVLARILSMAQCKDLTWLACGSHMSSRFSHLSALSLNQAAQPHTSHTTCHSSPSIPCILHCQVVLLVAESSDVLKLSCSPHSNHYSLSRSSL